MEKNHDSNIEILICADLDVVTGVSVIWEIGGFNGVSNK